MDFRCVFESFKRRLTESERPIQRSFLNLLFTLISFSLLSCATEIKQLPIAEWQFIDAATLKPIEGGWVHFAWYGPEENGRRSCKRGVLGQTGADGWFRDTAGASDWKPYPSAVYFIPGYEGFRFKYGDPDEEHIMAYAPQVSADLGKYPGFEAHLKSLGYVYREGPFSMNNEYHSYLWTKIMPSKGFANLMGHREIRQRYFIKYQSLPAQVGQNFSFMGRVCDTPGAENIGLQIGRVQYVDQLRSIASTRFFCDPRWKDSQVHYTEIKDWIWLSSWIFKDHNDAYVMAFENFGKSEFSLLGELMKFDDARRIKYCDLIMPMVEQVAAKLIASGPPKPITEVMHSKTEISE